MTRGGVSRAVRASLRSVGSVFVVMSLAWARVVDGFAPDRFDILGATLCLAGMAVIMYVPR